MFCTFTGNRHRDGHSLRGHRKKSVPTSNPKEKHKLESTLSQLTGQTIKRVAAKSSRAISKRADPCCHKPAMTAEFTLTTTYSTCWRAFLCCVFMFQSVCAANSKNKQKNCTQLQMCTDEKQKQVRQSYTWWKNYISLQPFLSDICCQCVCMFCCVCIVPQPPPCTRAAQWPWDLRASSGGAERERLGTNGRHSFIPSLPQSIFLWCPLINLPSAHYGFIYPPSMEHSASLFSSACLFLSQKKAVMFYLSTLFQQ